MTVSPHQWPKLPEFDYSFWGSYSTQGYACVDDPLVAQRTFRQSAVSGIGWGRKEGDELLYGLVEQWSVNSGGFTGGNARLYLGDRECLSTPLLPLTPGDCTLTLPDGSALKVNSYGRVDLPEPFLLMPGTTWKWIVEVPSLALDKHVGVDLLIGMSTYWKAKESR